MKKLISFLCCLLMVTTACGGGSSLSSEDQKVVDDLAVAIAESDNFGELSADVTKCIAEEEVVALGATYIQENNLTDAVIYDEWDPFDSRSGIDRDTFKEMYKGIVECIDGDFQALLGDDLDGVSEETGKCLLNLMKDDKYLDLIYDAGAADNDEGLLFSLFGECPSFLVDGLVSGAGLDKGRAECFADKISYESFMFVLENQDLPEDELDEGATEVIAEFFAAAVECDIDLADLG